MRLTRGDLIVDWTFQDSPDVTRRPLYLDGVNSPAVIVSCRVKDVRIAKDHLGMPLTS